VTCTAHGKSQKWFRVIVEKPQTRDRREVSVNVMYLYSGGAWFESRLGRQLADVRVLT